MRGVRFKAHKKNLAFVSPVLAGMLAVPSNHTISHAQDLPVVVLPEDAETIRIILAMAYNKPEGLQFRRGEDWRFVKLVWEAACKYEMYGLRACCQMALVWVQRFPSARADHCGLRTIPSELRATLSITRTRSTYISEQPHSMTRSCANTLSRKLPNGL